MLNCETPSLGIISTCDGRLEALGSQVFRIQEEVSKYFKGSPFIAIYCGGEGIKKPNEEVKYGNVTFNPLIIK